MKKTKISYILLIAVFAAAGIFVSGAVQAQELPYEPIITVQEEVPGEAADAFQSLLEKLNKDGMIPDLEGQTSYYGGHTEEKAEMDSIEWHNFTKAERFVFSANVTWASAAERPNVYFSGCSLAFNVDDKDEDCVNASLRMDGMLYFDAVRYGNYIDFGKYYYAPGSINGAADFTVIVDQDRAAVYVNGQRIVRKAGLPVMGDNIGLSIYSGTNKDFGIRCDWKDIFLYTW